MLNNSTVAVRNPHHCAVLDTNNHTSRTALRNYGSARSAEDRTPQNPGCQAL